MAIGEDIWNQMKRMQSDLNRFFSGVDEENYKRAQSDFKETEKEYLIVVEMPGVEKEDIKLNITEDEIVIKAETKKEDQKKEKTGEYSYSSKYAGFYRSFTLPEDAEEDKIEAKYKNGILAIKIPKNPKKKDYKEVKID